MSTAEIDRSQTAIRRHRCSRPIALALAHGLIGPNTSVFDYGCGRGEDVSFLKKRGIAAIGWDLNLRTEQSLAKADIVNLGYVLNVIEDPAERRSTLKKAFSLARQALIVAVRVDRTPARTTNFTDGHVTSRGTFQKIFTQTEFREYQQPTHRDAYR